MPHGMFVYMDLKMHPGVKFSKDFPCDFTFSKVIDLRLVLNMMLVPAA